MCDIRETTLVIVDRAFHGIVYAFIPKPKKKPPPVGEIGQKSALLEIAENSLEPFLGLSFVTEYHSTTGVICACNLCGVKFNLNDGVSHITGTKHRLHYLKIMRLPVYMNLKTGGKKCQIKKFLDAFTFDVEKEDGHGTPVVKVCQPAKTEEEEENLTIDDILAEEKYYEKGKTSAAASCDMTDEQREELRHKALLAQRLAGNSSFHDLVNQGFEQSRKNYGAKRARSLSPSFRDDKVEMQSDRMDAGFEQSRKNYGAKRARSLSPSFRDGKAEMQSDRMDAGFEQSKKNYGAKRARSPSPSFRDDKAEMQGDRMDAERLGPPQKTNISIQISRREFDGERPVFVPDYPCPRGPDYPYPRNPYLPHPRYPPHPPPPPAWSWAPYNRPALPPYPPLNSYDPIACRPPRPPMYSPYIDPPRHFTDPYQDPDSLRQIPCAPERYFDPDPLKCVLKSENRLAPDPFKRRLPAVRLSVIDYGYGSSSKAEIAKPSSMPAHQHKADKLEGDIQHVLGLGMEKRAPDSLALLSSTYSSPEKSPSPVPEKKDVKPTRALPVSKSYLEMPEDLKKLKDNRERQGVSGNVESRRNAEAESFPRTEGKEKGLGSSAAPLRKDSKCSSQNPDLSRRRSKSPRFSKYHKSRSPDLKRRRSRSPGHSRHHKSPDLRKQTSRNPGFSKHHKSRSPDLKRRRSRSPGHSRHYKSPDLRKRTSRSPGLSKHHKSRSPDLKRRRSRSPEHSRHHKSPDLRKRTSRSPGFSKHYKSISPDLKRRISRSPGHSRHYKSPDLRKRTSRSPGLSKHHKSRSPDLRTFEKRRTSRSPEHLKHHFVSKMRRSGSPRKHEIIVEKSRHDEDVDLLSKRPKSGEKSLKLEQNRSSRTRQNAHEVQDILLETDEDTQAEKIASLLLEMSGFLASEDPDKTLQGLFSNSELASALLAAKPKNKKRESESSLNRARRSVDKTEGKPRASSSRSPFEPSHSPSPASSRTRTLRDRPSLPKARQSFSRDVIMLESSPPLRRPVSPPKENVTFSLSGFGRLSSQSVRSTLPIDFGEEDEEED